MKHGDLIDPTAEVRYYEPLEELEKLTASAKALLAEAFDLVGRLSVPVGEGESVSHPALTGTRAVPSDDDVRQWFVARGHPQVDPDWITWPKERYNAQIYQEYLRDRPVLIVDPATAIDDQESAV